jgi:hypothetical protein
MQSKLQVRTSFAGQKVSESTRASCPLGSANHITSASEINENETKQNQEHLLLASCQARNDQQDKTNGSNGGTMLSTTPWRHSITASIG